MQSSNTEFSLKEKTEGKQKISHAVKRDRHEKTGFSPASLLLILTAAEGMKRLLINLRTMLVKENEKDRKGSSDGMQ